MDKDLNQFLKELEIESKSKSKKIAMKKDIFSQVKYTYSASITDSNCIDKVFEDGSRITGKIINGEFKVKDEK
jgi:hypothetical protein